MRTDSYIMTAHTGSAGDMLELENLRKAIKIINKSLKNIGREFSLTEDEMNKCLSNKKLEEEILKERIDAQKNYKISSTPTIYINEKKYESERSYKSFKKVIDKLL